MEIVTLHLRDQIEDVAFYMDHAYVISRERTLRVYNWTLFIEGLAQRYPDFERVLTPCFARNDLIGDEGRVWDGSRLDEFQGLLDSLTPLLSDQPVVGELSLSHGSFLDLLIYNRVLYAATTAGVFAVQLNQGHDELELGAAQKVTEIPGLNLKARYGILNVAAGDAGLQFIPTREFDKSAPEAAGRIYEDRSSQRTSWIGYDVLNVGMDGGLEYLVNSTRNVPHALRHQPETPFKEQRYVDRIGDRVIEAEDFLPEIRTDEVDCAFSSSRRIYVALRGGRIVTFGSDDGDPDEITKKRTLKLGDTVCYDGLSMYGGVAFDTEQGTYFSRLGTGDPSLIHPGRNLTVRSFNAAVYYRRLLCSVKDQSVFVSTVWLA